MISEYILQRNEYFASLFRQGFDVDRSYVIKEGKHKYDRIDVLEKIKQHIDFLDELEVKSVMLLMEPNFHSLCLVYALVLSNRTVIFCPENSSSEFLKKELEKTNADVILIGKDSGPQHRGKYFPLLTLHSESQFFYFRNKTQKILNFLPGLMWYTENKSRGTELCHFLYKRLSQHLTDFIQQFHLTSSDSFLLDKFFSYNVCIRAIFLPLMLGGKLTILTPRTTYSVEAFSAILQTDKISVLDVSANFFTKLQSWVVDNRLGAQVVGLRKIFFDAQLPPFYNFQQWFSYINPSQDFYKLYSSAEFFNVFSYKISSHDTYEDLYQFGENTNGSDYILVEYSKDTYELFVSGAQTTGYFDVYRSLQYFAVENGKRYFKTGDLVKISDDKLFFYAKHRHIFIKNNQQINLYRIEQEFYQHAPLGQCAAIVGFKGDITLYIEGSNNAEHLFQLKNHFKKTLPSYMQVDFYEFKKLLPMTVSGYVNYDELRKDVSAFFKKLFIGGRVNDRAKLKELNLSEVEYYKLSEYIISRTGQFFDLTYEQGNFEIGDIKDHLKPLPRNTKGHIRQLQLSQYMVQNHIQPLLQKGQDKGCFIYRLPLKKQVSIYKLKSAILATIKGHFLLSCKVVNQSENFFLVRIKPSTHLTHKKSHIFASFKPIENSQLVMTANADQLINIRIEQNGDENQLIISYHAMILDLWSFKNLLTEIFARYEDRHIVAVPNLKKQVSELNRMYQQEENIKKDISTLIEVFNRFPNVNMQSLLPLFHVNNSNVSSLCHFPKQTIEQFKSKYGLSQDADSSVFLLIYYVSLSNVLELDSLVIHLAFNNRLAQSIYASKLALNSETYLPLTIIPHSNYAQMTAYFSMMLSYYFNFMDVSTIQQLNTNAEIQAWQKEQVMDEFTLKYAFVPFEPDQSCFYETLVDWDKADYCYENFSKGLISFKVIELKHSFIVHLDSKISSGIHHKLENEFKELLQND